MSTQKRRAARKNQPKRTTTKPKRPPLLSSDEILAALRRLGFEDGPAKGSSHLSMHRPREGGGNDVVSVVIGEKEVPRGTLAGILDTGNITLDDFLKALGRRR